MDEKIVKKPKNYRKISMQGRGGPMMMAGEKPKDLKTSLKKLFKYLKEYMPAIIVSVAFALLGTIVSIISPKLLGNISTEISNFVMGITGASDMLSKTKSISLILITLFAFAAIFKISQSWITTKISQKLTLNFRGDIAKKINKLPLKYFDGRSYGDVLSIITNDVDSISQSTSSNLIMLVESVCMFIGVLIMMFTISWKIALISMLIAPLSMIAIIFVIKSTQKYFRDFQGNFGIMNGQLEESYSGHIVVKAFCNEDDEIKRYTDVNKLVFKAGWKSQFFSSLMMPVMTFVGNLGFVVVCVVTAILIMDKVNPLEFGAITSFMIYIKFLIQPLNQIAQATNGFQTVAAAAERVFEFLDEEELENEEGKTAKLENVKGDVEFRNVNFGYTDKAVINDFSLKAKAGQKIAIVGPTGAGKTTLVNLLMRFYEVNGGDILIDGVSIKDLTRENVHSIFGMVLQDTWLFEGSIRENIIYNTKNVTEQKLEEVAKLARIDHYIRSLPKGYDMYLDDDAALSQGQKQLFTIARAMVEDAPMLILDEATSSVDTRTEILIQEAMDELTKGRTSFIIAHRLSTIKNADVIIVLDNGDVVETGSHEELIEKKGFYADLYYSQFESAATKL